MNIFFRTLAFSTVLLGTTFCSKEHQSPTTPKDAVAASDITIAPPSGPPIGFDPQTCYITDNGVSSVLLNEAINNTYYWDGSQVSAATAQNIYNGLASSPVFTFDANGHVASSVPYASRVNNYKDGVEEQLTEYSYYVYYLSLQGYNVENPEDVKAIIREQFDLTIPVQPEEANILSQTEKDQIALIAAAANAQMPKTFRLLDALYGCGSASPRASAANIEAPATEAKAGSPVKHLSFKDFQLMRKQGKIKDSAFAQAGAAQQRFSFKKLLKIAGSIAVFTVVGATAGFFSAGPAAPVGAWVGGAFGFTYALGQIIQHNNCWPFGRCG